MAQLPYNGGVDLDTDTFRVVLVTSAYTYSAAHTTWADASAAEVSNANGYTTHGQALSTPTMNQTSGVGIWDAVDPDWTASGSGLTARRAIIIKDADGNGALASTDKLICTCLLDATPADVVVAAGNHLTIQLSALGIAQTTLA
jgi:hypothetical protein